MSEDAAKITVTDKRRIKSAEDTIDDTTAPDLERVPTYVEELNRKIAENDERLKEYIAAYKEKMADMDQVRKRLEADVENRSRQRFGDLVAELLPIVDDFDRAIESASKGSSSQDMAEGLARLREGMMKALVNRGLKTIQCAGEPFNPETAQAVSVAPVDDEAQDNMVLEQLASGYIYEGRVLRPALVRVGKMK
ncbi:MAG: nucleotide exchange factor GrpE [Nitrospinae bacterium]|nr:nucleotide exchange factor GrpE [Nitrospinota bacterium]